MNRKYMMLMMQLLGLALAAMESRAQPWPTKPLRAIVPFAAGSLADIAPRVVFEQLSLQLGQSIVVETRPGAGATIGSSIVAKSAPDGYTVLVNSNAHTIAPSLYPSLGYHPARDFASVVPLGVSPLFLVVSPTKGYKSVSDFVAAAKAKPGAFNFSSLGVGSATHLGAE
ncbi:MAG: tripartite tricarboxylate transporter substrate-binding protein, partial [Burkholderiales bacterium]